MCPSGDGGVAVCDFGNNRIQIVYPDGRPTRLFTTMKEGKGAVGITNYDGTFIVVDAKHQLSQLRFDGAPGWSMGSKGDKLGMFNHPFGVASLPDGRIVVSDQNNHRLQLLDVTGKPLATLGAGKQNVQLLNHPRGLAIDSNGHIVVTDHANDRIIVLSISDECVHVRGSSGSGRGQLNRPFDVAVDAAGNILVADWGNSRIVVFAPNGDASHFTVPGKPQGVCVENGNVVVSLGEGQILVY
jgi:tripartite motif-containing protein 71